MRHAQSTTLFTVATIAIACFCGVAHANGTTLMPGGSASVGRGGAVAARPEDSLSIATNPAGLAFLPGSRLTIDVNAVVQKMCVDPYGYYGWGVSGHHDLRSEFGDEYALDDPRHPTIGATYATTPLGTVCNSAPTTVLPQFAWSGRFGDNFMIGAGVVAPVMVGGMQFGGTDGTIETPYGPRPTPTRYSLIKQEVTYASAPTFAAAYRFLPFLSAGLSLQILSVAVRATAVQAAIGGTSPGKDMLATVTTQDFFIPVVTFALHARPVREVNLMAAFKWSDDFRGSGDVVYETNTYYRGPPASPTNPIPFKNDPLKLRDVTVRFPWELDVGARYASMLPGHEEGDPMATERWDVEADLAYSFNRRAAISSASLGQDATLETRLANGTKGESQTVEAKDVPAANIDNHSVDSYAVRIGGSLSVVPKRFAVNAGGFYESRAVDLAYADITQFAFQRVGLGLGVFFRFGDFDLRASATHIFSETVDVAPSQSSDDQSVGGSFDALGNRVGGGVLKDSSAPPASKADAVAAKKQTAAAAFPGQPNRVINAGRYSAAFDVVSIGMTYHF